MSAMQPTAAFNNSVEPDVRERRRAHGGLFAAAFVLVVVAGAQTATQLCARDFAYQPVLGANARGFYAPWAIALWAARWGRQYPAAFQSAAHGGLLVFAVGMLLLCAAKLALVRANPYIHGSARWANAKDLRQSGLLGPKRGLRLFHRSTSDGVYVGSWVDRRGRQHYLRHSGPEHVLCYAPTRSGKGVGL